MSVSPDPISYRTHLPDVYRFAFLMTGHPGTASEVLGRTVERAARGGIGDLRDAQRVKRWLFTEARRQCARSSPPPSEPPPENLHPLRDAPEPADADEPRRLADQFAHLPDGERGALVLFYLYLFDPLELAEVLEIKPAELAPLLTQGRELLRRHEARSSQEHPRRPL